jgi:hypothetical protein
MNKNRSIGFLLFCWFEILSGAAGSAVFFAIVTWLVHGIWFVPNFGDSNIAGVFAMVWALFLWPCVFILIAGIGVLRRKAWVRTMNLAMYPILGLLGSLSTGFLTRGGWLAPLMFVIYAALTLLSAWVLARHSIVERWKRQPAA